MRRVGSDRHEHPTPPKSHRGAPIVRLRCAVDVPVHSAGPGGENAVMSSTATVRGPDGLRRCGWSLSTTDYVAYHDDEWGRPVVDDTRLYEKLCLEGFQSGLSWLTILRKREGFRRAFAGFDPGVVARFDARDVERLLADAAIVRHRGKIEATIANARATIEVQDRYGSLAALVWSFEPRRRGRPVPEDLGDVPATTPESTALSKELRRHGFRFVGPTTAYAAMQSLGIVNDHLRGCHRAGRVRARPQRGTDRRRASAVNLDQQHPHVRQRRRIRQDDTGHEPVEPAATPRQEGRGADHARDRRRLPEHDPHRKAPAGFAGCFGFTPSCDSTRLEVDDDAPHDDGHTEEAGPERLA